MKLLITMLLFSSGAFASISDSCINCHGKNGVSTDTNMPTIAGMSSTFIKSTFKVYKDKQRVCNEVAGKDGKRMICVK